MKGWKAWKKWFLAALVVLLAFLPAAHVLATSIQDAKDEKKRLEQKQEEIQATMEELETKKSDIVSYIETLDQKQREIEAEIEKLNEEQKAAEQELANTQMELQEAKETVANQYDIMKRRIKYMYENGTSDYVEIFLNAESMADLLNQAEYMAKISEYDNELLGRYEEAQAEVEVKEAEIEQQLIQLEELAMELQLEKEANEQLTADKAAQVAEYSRLISEAGDRVEEYGIAIAKQEDLIDELIEEERKRQEEEERKRQEEERRRQEEEARRQEEEARRQEEEARRQEEARQEEARRQEEEARRQQQEAAQQQTQSSSQQEQTSQSGSQSGGNGQALLNGGFIWPLPSSTRITSGFGEREEIMSGSGTYHSGIDIGTATGSNILAAASGTVVEASYNWSMGNYVLINHGDGIYTIYMHSSQLLVSAGSYVNQGQVIALVGSTGLSTGPHLHFGLKINGSYVNPLNYVSY